MKDRYGLTVPDSIHCMVSYNEDYTDVTYTGHKDKKRLKDFKSYRNKFLHEVWYAKQKVDPTRIVFDEFYDDWGSHKGSIYQIPIEELTFEDILKEDWIKFSQSRLMKKSAHDFEFNIKELYIEQLCDEARYGELLTYAGTCYKGTSDSYDLRGLKAFAVNAIKIGKPCLTIDAPKYGWTVTLKARYDILGYASYPLTYDCKYEVLKDGSFKPLIFAPKRLLVDVMINKYALFCVDVLEGRIYDFMCQRFDRVEDSPISCRTCVGGISRYECERFKKTAMVCAVPISNEGFNMCKRSKEDFEFIPIIDDILDNYFMTLSGNVDTSKVRKDLQCDTEVAILLSKNFVRDSSTRHLAVDFANTYVFKSDREDGRVTAGAVRYSLLEYAEEIGNSPIFDIAIVEKSNREIIDYCLN